LKLHFKRIKKYQLFLKFERKLTKANYILIISLHSNVRRRFSAKEKRWI